MEYIPQIVVNGFIIGSIYALGALGFTLIARTNRFMHLAHSAVIMSGVYLFFSLFRYWKLNFFLCSVFTIILTSLFGVGIYRFVYKPLLRKKASLSVMLLVSLVLKFIIENITLLIFGAVFKQVPNPFGFVSFKIYSVSITPVEMIVVLASLFMFVIIYLLIHKTTLGVIFRALSSNLELSKIRGIDTERYYNYSFALVSALAGYTAILIAINQNFSPTLSQMMMSKIFTASLIGGLTFLPGAVLGGIFFGYQRESGVIFFPDRIQGSVCLFVVICPFGVTAQGNIEL